MIVTAHIAVDVVVCDDEQSYSLLTSPHIDDVWASMIAIPLHSAGHGRKLAAGNFTDVRVRVRVRNFSVAWL